MVSPSSAISNPQAISPPAATLVKVFTYGTLKRGFSNHGLIQELMKSGDAFFLGAARTAGPLPLVCGPYRVPFLLNFPGAGRRVSGELYAVSQNALSRLDELEGTRRGHYERRPIKLTLIANKNGEENVNRQEAEDEEEEDVLNAEAYYAHWSYAEELWRQSGEKGYEAYTAKEAMGYVKRKDRPRNISFLEQIQVFVTSQN